MHLQDILDAYSLHLINQTILALKPQQCQNMVALGAFEDNFISGRLCEEFDLQVRMVEGGYSVVCR